MENPLDEMLAVINTTIEEWKAKNTAAVIKNRVKDMLDNQADLITLQLLGFKADYYGKWELDHCNGRSGESAAGDFIRKAQSEAVKEWLSNIQLPKLSPSVKAKLAKDMDYEYSTTLRTRVQQMAQQKVEQDAQKLFQILQSSEKVEQYQRVIRLIDSDPH